MSMDLVECGACGGLVPAAASECVHCGAGRAERPGWVRAIARAAAGGAALLTLMACYGAPPGYGPPPGSGSCPGGDADHDGVCAPTDCNDNDPTIYPGAADPDGDGIDQNCDGVDGWRDPGKVAAPTTGATGAAGATGSGTASSATGSGGAAAATFGPAPAPASSAIDGGAPRP